MMKLAAIFAVVAVLGQAQTANPIEKATQMLQDFRATIEKEQADALATHKETMEFCRSTKMELGHNIDNNKDKIESLTATNLKAAADIETLGSAIAELAQNIAKNGEDKKEAIALRKQQAADFAAADKELAESVDMLSRAISVLRKWSTSQNKGGEAALMQVVNAVSVVMQAANINADSKTSWLPFSRVMMRKVMPSLSAWPSLLPTRTTAVASSTCSPT